MCMSFDAFQHRLADLQSLFSRQLWEGRGFLLFTFGVILEKEVPGILFSQDLSD